MKYIHIHIVFHFFHTHFLYTILILIRCFYYAHLILIQTYNTYLTCITFDLIHSDSELINENQN